MSPREVDHEVQLLVESIQLMDPALVTVEDEQSHAGSGEIPETRLLYFALLRR
jgi:hypothetical protein